MEQRRHLKKHIEETRVKRTEEFIHALLPQMMELLKKYAKKRIYLAEPGVIVNFIRQSTKVANVMNSFFRP
jgi:hypothetical protein